MPGPCLVQENLSLPSRKVPCPQPGPLRTHGLKMFCRVWQSYPQWYSDGRGWFPSYAGPQNRRRDTPSILTSLSLQMVVSPSPYICSPSTEAFPTPSQTHLLGFCSILNRTEDQRVKDHSSRRRFPWTSPGPLITILMPGLPTEKWAQLGLI